ncbi:hypothetical protein [Stenotrophomonas sp. PS02289]|uniref:hypothetical protein n=1 Tax=Stenotrophomonas sp. PS02289 TaxID=2991422 RepID=UPI00249A9155|nr:hypothetical protein [Stenotrophomonas sp. PS02289]
MSNETLAVDMELVKAIYVAAASQAIGNMNQNIPFSLLLERAFEAAAAMAQAQRERQSQGLDNWLGAVPGMR